VHFTTLTTLGMMYLVRGGLVWGQMGLRVPDEGVLSEVRGVYTPWGGQYNIVVIIKESRVNLCKYSF